MIMANRKLSNENQRLCNCSEYQSYDKPVQNGLAMTPAKVRELTAKGIAVSMASPVENFSGNPEKGNFDIDPIFTRDIDQNTLWEKSETSRRKLMSSRDKLTKQQRIERNKQKTK